jgi:hypothetical protein
VADAKDKIDDAAETFYRGLPEETYPKALIEEFPRIANRIFTLRGNKVALKAYFDSLLTDERGKRQGFQFPVLVNIQTLYDTMVGITDGFIKTGRFSRSRR